MHTFPAAHLRTSYIGGMQARIWAGMAKRVMAHVIGKGNGVAAPIQMRTELPCGATELSCHLGLDKDLGNPGRLGRAL